MSSPGLDIGPDDPKDIKLYPPYGCWYYISYTNEDGVLMYYCRKMKKNFPESSKAHIFKTRHATEKVIKSMSGSYNPTIHIFQHPNLKELINL